MLNDPDSLRMLGLLPRAEPPVPALQAPGAGTGGDLAMGGAYEGADRFSRELAMWAPALQSANQDILPEKPVIDARVRDTLRNDAYVAGGANIIRDNIVGGMFLLNSKPAWKVLGLDEKWAEEFQEEVESKFTLWAESPNNWVDASRMNTFTGLVRLAVGIDVMCGEVLATAEWLRDSPRPYNTAIQMVDLDRLSTPDTMIDGPRLRGGVSLDYWGAPQGYHIRMAHPADWSDMDRYRHRYVPIRKPWGRLQVIHILEQHRAGQSRGISEIASGLKELQITKKFRGIVLQNAVVNASYAASIESDLPTDAIYQTLGSGNVRDGIKGYVDGFFNEVVKYSKAAQNMHIDGVKIPHLYPGTKLQLRPAGNGGPLGSDFEQSLLRYIAANLGVSYEQLSKDYSKTNYSSARAGIVETWKRMQSRKRMVADRFASSIYRLWLEETINKGGIDSMPRKPPSFYDGLNADAYSECEWVGASRGQIDELKETQAAALRLKHNLTTYEDEMARLGKDWRKTLVQRQREVDEMRERDLLPVEDDNMMNAVSGAPRDASEE